MNNVNRSIAFNADNIQVRMEKMKKIRYIKNIKDKNFFTIRIAQDINYDDTSHDMILCS